MINLLKKFLFIFLTVFSLQITSQDKKTDFVNPFIGTGDHGHTFPGATLPFGMVQLSPDTRIDGSWDGCSGYNRSDSVIYGFSHTHLSGTGCSDWGDVLLMPGVGIPSFDNKIYSSTFNRKNEKASPGYYEVILNKNKIKAELTVTSRVGIHRYSFPKKQNVHLVIDLLHRDKTLASKITIVDSVTITGFRNSEAWAKNQLVYFAIKFSKPFKNIDLINHNKIIKRGEDRRQVEKAFIYFDNIETLQVKVAISGVGESGALNNLNAEAKHWDFEKYKSEALQTWEKQLNKIEIVSSNRDEKTKFYSAMYHCFIHPSLNMDVDRQYRGRDNQIHKAVNFVNYQVFSLWDTYRALHPLFTIIERERTQDFISSFYTQFKESGRLPVWELSSNETDCMIGYHSVSVIADAFVKGIPIRDTLGIYQAMKAASNYSNFSIPQFHQKDFLQIDDENESVSKSLEYAYDDWCIAQMASILNKKEDEKYYLQKALSYKNLFDTSTGFMRPRKNGNWLSPFFPEEINNHFTEGNSWQYSFYVPQDIEGLMNLHGGELKFEQKLDALFNASSKTRGREQADVTGLIGQYAHGNEPSHHMAYLYNYVGQPQKTIKIVKKICSNFYKNSDDGLIGNEDCGQMSAWFVFSSMGFYPVCPGNTNYILSEPLFEKVKINLENGRNLEISNNVLSNQIIHHIELNKQISLNSFISHDAILEGGELKFIKNNLNEKNTQYGLEKINRPLSKIDNPFYLPSPIIKANSQIFENKLEVSIDPINSKEIVCVYTIDGKDPDVSSKVYTAPFFIDSTTTIKSKLFSNHSISAISMAKFFRLKNNYQIAFTNTTNGQYSANGVQSINDGIYGDLNWRKGDWLGIQEKDFECIIDLKEQKSINYFALNCLQDSRSWILFPKKVSFYVSNDKEHYQLAAEVTENIDANNFEVLIKKFESQSANQFKVRYVKVTATNAGKLPEGHNGAGGDSFIFCDELEIK
jgi:predicted alpha-1,2-mannosidase